MFKKVKEVKLSAFGEQMSDTTASEKFITYSVFTVAYIPMLLLMSLLWALILDNLLGFIDFSYWEWFRGYIALSIITFGWSLSALRTQQGVKSILRRV